MFQGSSDPGDVQSPDFSWRNFSQEYPSTLDLAIFCAACRESKIQEYLDKESYQSWKVHQVRKNNWLTYKGVALVNEEKKQLVLVHRGTVATSILNWISNLSVLNLQSTGFQLREACLFADDMKDFSLENGYQMIITGHSMGGVLAQVSAFSTKYLEIENNDFKRCSEIRDDFHPHVECFDSPGSYRVVRNMIGKYQTNPCSQEFDKATAKLDITNFVVCPNFPNTKGVHLGTVICVDKDLSPGTSRSLVGNHPLDQIIAFLRCKEKFSKKITCWADQENKFEEVEKNKVPEYCLTSYEIDLIEFIQTCGNCKVNIEDVEICMKITVERSSAKGRILNLPPKLKRSKFLAYIHHLSRYNFKEILTTRVKEYLVDPIEMCKYFSIDFYCKELHSLSIKSSHIFKNPVDPYPELFYVSMPRISNRQRIVYASILRNSLAIRHPSWKIVVFFETNSTKERNLKEILSKIRDAGEKWMFILVQNEKGELNAKPKEFLSTIAVANGSNVYITTDQRSSSTCDHLETNLLMESLDERSNEIFQELRVGLQNKEYKISGSFTNLKDASLLDVLEKYEEGCLMPNTWKEEASENFYLPQYLLSKDGKNTTTDICDMIYKPNSSLNIVAAKPGMGKTSLFRELRTKFTKQIANANSEVIVLLVSLRKLNHLLEKMKGEPNVTILVKYFGLTVNSVEKKLFESFIAKEKSVVFLFDGFDEVWASCREKAAGFIAFFCKQNCMYQIWVSTRNDTISFLQNERFNPYQVFDLDQFSEKEQKEYLQKLLEKTEECETDVEAIFCKMVNITKEFGKEFLRVPLTLKLLVLAEAHKSNAEIIKPFKLVEIYLEKKSLLFKIEKQDKIIGTFSLADVQNFSKNYYFNFFIFYAFHQILRTSGFIKKHRELDLQVNPQRNQQIFKELKHCGLLDGENNFVHRSIADYMVAVSLKILFGAASEEQQKDHLEWIKDCTLNITSKAGNNTKISIFASFVQKLIDQRITKETLKYLDDMLIDFIASEIQTMNCVNQFSGLVNINGSKMVDYLTNVAITYKLPGVFYLLKCSMTQLTSDAIRARFIYKSCGMILVEDGKITTSDLLKVVNEEIPPDKNVFNLLDKKTSSEKTRDVQAAISEMKNESTFSEHAMCHIYEMVAKMGFSFARTYHLPHILPYDLASFSMRKPTLRSLQLLAKLNSGQCSFEYPLVDLRVSNTLNNSISYWNEVRNLVLHKRLYSCLIYLDKVVDILEFNKHMFRFPLVKSRHDVPLLVKMICFGHEQNCFDLIQTNATYLTEAIDFMVENYEIFYIMARKNMDILLKEIALSFKSKLIEERNVNLKFVDGCLLNVVIKNNNFNLFRLLSGLGFCFHKECSLPNDPLLYALVKFFDGYQSMINTIEFLLFNKAQYHLTMEFPEKKLEELLENIRSFKVLETFLILKECDRFKEIYFGKYQCLNL